ncbi:polysaccharide biosynthesis/export family protein [Chitinophaga rhizophila]|uniref:Polysaccharide biosynthesis/export family protein n=1 Tax=Chitinophaga rhizophila TaxID=2866212 RepID=A0ABS7G7M6_9BACT|nr:polysaccharide biosynthesis/export family protein [Chitinophaga rhizophila]MBW8683667.1 polysaccharide biosynthesis/export family protein [Chitinophaga rhizophila]
MILKKDYLRYIFVVPVLICCFFFTSCVSTQKSVYFNNLSDTVIAPVKGNFEPVIHKNDVLQIVVSSMNPEDAIVFNTPSVASTGIAGVGTQTTGYMVNEQGNIEYPVLGQVKAEGLTKAQLTAYLRNELDSRKLMKDPVVTIRFLNYRVTVIGEVARPTVVTVPSEKITVLEALGMAGDITVYGKKENVLLIREVNGEKTIKRLNLNSSEILTSPYYYLQSNDVVYVEPNKSKVAVATGSRTTIPIIISTLSLIVLTLDRLIVN